MSHVSPCYCLCPIHWSHWRCSPCQTRRTVVMSVERSATKGQSPGYWRCTWSWSSADRQCSSYIWMINYFIAYKDATYVRGLMVINFIPSMGGSFLIVPWKWGSFHYVIKKGGFLNSLLSCIGHRRREMILRVGNVNVIFLHVVIIIIKTYFPLPHLPRVLIDISSVVFVDVIFWLSVPHHWQTHCWLTKS